MSLKKISTSEKSLWSTLSTASSWFDWHLSHETKKPNNFNTNVFTKLYKLIWFMDCWRYMSRVPKTIMLFTHRRFDPVKNFAFGITFRWYKVHSKFLVMCTFILRAYSECSIRLIKRSRTSSNTKVCCKRSKISK